jgi:hypothetical protein
MKRQPASFQLPAEVRGPFKEWAERTRMMKESMEQKRRAAQAQKVELYRRESLTAKSE